MNIILFAATVALAPLQEAPDTVTPRFAWAPGTILEGQVEVESMQSQGGEVLPAQNLEVSLTRSISADPRGLLITSQVEGPAGQALPAYVISEAGDFVEVDGVEEMVTEMREQLLAAARAQNGGVVPPEARGLAEQMFNRETIEASVRQEHEMLVGFWNDRTLDRNAVEVRRMLTQDAITGEILPTEVEIVWRGYTPCVEGDAEAKCLDLEISYFPDSDALATAFEGVLGAQNQGEIFVTRALQERIVRLHVEPENLIPRWIEEHSESEFDVEAEGEIVDLAIQQVETTTFQVRSGLNPLRP
ncbi:MAG: hypothetical protein RQ745_03890 [Longimicrobiales bacterium]|nr:hypothetical protein [Longimicrobiales bacterium]